LETIEWYQDNSLKWQEKGIGYQKQNDLKKAYECFFTAAEFLLKAAKISDGDQKKKRFEISQNLIKYAESLENQANEEKYGSSGRKSEKASHSSGTQRDGKEVETSEDFLARMGILNVEVPNVTFNDVAGLDSLKEDIKANIILPFTNPSAAEAARELDHKPGGGILLYGPPGTGKTFIVKAISNEVHASFILINPATLLSQWFGEFETNIKKLFIAARESAPCVLFFDEIDAIAPKRSSSYSTVMKRAVPTLLSELDGFAGRDEKGILVIGATNTPWDLDEAIIRPGRLGEKIYVPPPDRAARKKIFQLELNKAKKEEIDYDLLAERTEGYSGADITFICDKTKNAVYKEALKTNKTRPISTDDILNALIEIKPSINREMLRKFEKFAEST
jgi:transitional endoplasmic reticulum ATPase